MIAVVVAVFFTSCLRNLNEIEFFRKLEIKNKDYYDWVYPKKAEAELALKETLEETLDMEVEWITFWGESRYSCGDVILSDEEDFIVVLGEYREAGEEESRLYEIWFIPSEEEVVQEAFLIDY